MKLKKKQKYNVKTKKSRRNNIHIEFLKKLDSIIIFFESHPFMFQKSHNLRNKL